MVGVVGGVMVFVVLVIEVGGVVVVGCVGAAVVVGFVLVFRVVSVGVAVVGFVVVGTVVVVAGLPGVMKTLSQPLPVQPHDALVPQMTRAPTPADSRPALKTHGLFPRQCKVTPWHDKAPEHDS